jgi:hypothetical protein
MRRQLLILFAALAIAGCGKKGDNTPNPSPPEKALLLFPAQNSACTVVTDISATESSVNLHWAAATNADSYEVIIKNLLNGTIIHKTATVLTAEVALTRNTPYSWFVVSKSGKTSELAQSDTWKFYNPGPSASFYVPFPADTLVPASLQSVTATGGKINLSWKGSDADNDIVGYDIYLGTSNTLSTPLKTNIKDMFLNDMAVSAGLTYYWKVVTKDAHGNTSDTGIYQFSVK